MGLEKRQATPFIVDIGQYRNPLDFIPDFAENVEVTYHQGFKSPYSSSDVILIPNLLSPKIPRSDHKSFDPALSPENNKEIMKYVTADVKYDVNSPSNCSDADVELSPIIALPRRSKEKQEIELSASSASESDDDIECFNCRTRVTSLWRKVRDIIACNACALFFKLHGFHRPISMKTDTIRRRRRECKG